MAFENFSTATVDDSKHGFSRPKMYKENLTGTVDAYDHHLFNCYKNHELHLSDHIYLHLPPLSLYIIFPKSTFIDGVEGGRSGRECWNLALAEATASNNEENAFGRLVKEVRAVLLNSSQYTLLKSDDDDTRDLHDLLCSSSEEFFSLY
ncbi:hypothetical protein K1719_015972 [Acacia pycnantha]|nr:hypothetical protein K1719_015972 [Acacia pycnantha]